MTYTETSQVPSNLLYDQHLCVEWASDTGLLSRLAASHPLVRINRMTVRQYLNRALGYLVQSGVPLRDVWELSDLVTPEAFEKITAAALAGSPGAARCIAIILITIGREWVGLDAAVLARLGAIADELPLAVNRSKRHRLPKHSLTASSRYSVVPGHRGLRTSA